jgi:hypothetical protein
MEFRFLGNSGLKVSAISYGNRVTHGSQVEADQATACVRAALEEGISPPPPPQVLRIDRKSLDVPASAVIALHEDLRERRQNVRPRSASRPNRRRTPPCGIGKRALPGSPLHGSSQAASLQQQSAATRAQPGGGGYDHARLARRKRHSMRPAPPLCKQGVRWSGLKSWKAVIRNRT